MNPEDALGFLDELVQDMELTRREHSRAVRAIQTLQCQCGELQEIRARLAKLEKAVSEQEKDDGNAVPLAQADS